MDTIDPLLTDKEAAAILTCSVATFHRRVADGTVPKAIKIGPGMARWPQSEIKQVIEAAKARRSQAA